MAPRLRTMAEAKTVSRLIETARLKLRPCVHEDVDDLQRIFVLPEVRLYLFDGQRVDREWVVAAVEDSLKLFRRHGVGLYIVSLKCEEVGIGFGGFREFFDPPQLQLLFGLEPASWGKGYAAELASELVRLSLTELGLEEVIAAADRPNEASFRVMERAGLLRWKETDEGPFGTIYYRLRRAEQQAPEPPEMIAITS